MKWSQKRKGTCGEGRREFGGGGAHGNEFLVVSEMGNLWVNETLTKKKNTTRRQCLFICFCFPFVNCSVSFVFVCYRWWRLDGSYGRDIINQRVPTWTVIFFFSSKYHFFVVVLHTQYFQRKMTYYSITKY